MSSYNKHYLTENYFGNSYPELIEYFDSLDKNLTVLDLGCGQGRDSLALGRMRFSVVGIDLSSIGIKQLNEIATKQQLNVKGIVGNLKDIQNISKYDIILMDSMFHFYKKDIDDETKILNSIIDNIKLNGRLVIIVQKSFFRVRYLKEIIDKSKNIFFVEYEKSFTYKEFNSKFYIIAFRKSDN